MRAIGVAVEQVVDQFLFSFPVTPIPFSWDDYMGFLYDTKACKICGMKLISKHLFYHMKLVHGIGHKMKTVP